MNIELIKDQVALVYLTIETESAFEVYGGTARGAFGVCQTGPAQWLLTVSEAQAAAAAMRPFNVFARELETGREWRILDGGIVVAPRTTSAPGEKISPVEYRITVPVVAGELEIPGIGIAAGIPGPQGPKGDPGPPGEGGISDSERTLLLGAAQRGGANTFTAANTFTGEVDMSTAQVTPPEGWNVGELTAEQVQAVVPMAFGEYTTAPSAAGSGSVAIGDSASARSGTYGTGVAVGRNAKADKGGTALGANAIANESTSVTVGKAQSEYSGVCVGDTAYAAYQAVALGYNAKTKNNAISIGCLSKADASHATAVGLSATAYAPTAITLGTGFSETVDGTNVYHTCTTQGTGSITIGAGANTLNNGDTESSNSVTIGCKASNKGADSVVIGAQASGNKKANVVVGAGASSAQNKNVAIGANAKISSSSYTSTALGADTSCSTQEETAVGYKSKTSGGGRSTSLGAYSTATKIGATAVGYMAKSANEGCMVFSSLNKELTYKTQLYFSGAGTPLANEYEDGEAMMGYVVTDSKGNILTDAEGNAMVGTQKLSVLFPNNRGENAFTPAMLSMDEDWTPKPMFHPSDLDMPVEEPSEPEEYTPLPVWPIVEPEVPEDLANGKE